VRNYITRILVDDQEKALQFYTTKLGFTVKHDLPMDGPRWLTLVSPEGTDSVEPLLEPNDNPMLNGLVQTYQKSLFDNGIPAAMFAVDDVETEFDLLAELEVRVALEPAEMGPVQVARYDDTCGNLNQITSPTRSFFLRFGGFFISPVRLLDRGNISPSGRRPFDARAMTSLD